MTFDHAGTCVVDADQAGTADYSAATPGQQSFAVTVADTAVSVGSSLTPSVFGQEFHATATVSGFASPAGTVQFAVDGADVGSAVTVASRDGAEPDPHRTGWWVVRARCAQHHRGVQPE